MENRRIAICFLLLLCIAAISFGQEYFPNIPGYQTLICDLHTHTVFSDGLVWPTVRIDEAVREHLDCIAISDHIEYQPHKDDIPTNHNRPYEIASEKAEKKNILLIKGAEITRDTPPGHYNALFLSDINPLVEPEFLTVIEKANEQNAFVFWNHHTWKGLERGQWTDLQTTMYEKKWLHGMEVANGGDYYPLAHQWCLERNLTMLGNSDIHSPSLFYPYTAQKHRTVNLIFAKERTVEAIREALWAGRTAVWFNNQLVGRQDYLKPLFDACVTITESDSVQDGEISFEMANNALVDMELERSGETGPLTIQLPAYSTVTVKVELSKGAGSAALSYHVKNFLVAPKKGLEVTFNVSEMAKN